MKVEIFATSIWIFVVNFRQNQISKSDNNLLYQFLYKYDDSAKMKPFKKPNFQKKIFYFKITVFVFNIFHTFQIFHGFPDQSTLIVTPTKAIPSPSLSFESPSMGIESLFHDFKRPSQSPATLFGQGRHSLADSIRPSAVQRQVY